MDSLPTSVQRQIVPFIDSEVTSVDQLYDAAQRWFDTSMAAASDWYSQQASWISILVAIVFAVALNIDTIGIASKLAQQPTRRAALVNMAQQIGEQYKKDPTSICPSPIANTSGNGVTNCLDTFTDTGSDLIGWNERVATTVANWGWITLLVGWIVSGFAMSLGARFWFDALSRLLSIRAGLSDKDLEQASQSAVPQSKSSQASR